jgi:hypothetical protein
VVAMIYRLTLIEKILDDDIPPLFKFRLLTRGEVVTADLEEPPKAVRFAGNTYVYLDERWRQRALRHERHSYIQSDVLDLDD